MIEFGNGVPGGIINKNYKATDEDKVKIHRFVEDYNYEEYIEKRGQTNLTRLKNQNHGGKLVEVGFSDLIKNIPDEYDVIDDVDFDTYEGFDRRKFVHDLKILRKKDEKEIRISCKCSLKPYYGHTELLDGTKINDQLPSQYSYLIQHKNQDGFSGGKDTSEVDIYVFGNMLSMYEVEIYAWVDAKHLEGDKMYVEPFLETHKGKKRAVQQYTTCAKGNGLNEPFGIYELIHDKRYTREEWDNACQPIS